MFSKTSLSTSIYVPCIPGHFHFLENAIREYLNGVVIPDEIVIGLAEGNLVPELKKKKLLYKFRDKNIRLESFDETLYAGPNRQKAKKTCNADLILYHDADDLPDRRRVALIKSIFENTDILALNHSYLFLEQRNKQWKNIKTFQTISPTDIYECYFPNGQFMDCIKRTRAYGSNIPGYNFNVCAGPVCIRKDVLNHVLWPSPEQIVFERKNPRDMEDYQFCMEVLFKLKKSIVIDVPLYYYRSGATLVGRVKTLFKSIIGKLCII